MADLLTPADIERLAQRAGIPIAEVCRRAGVAPSIFSRWKAGKTEPNLDNYRRIRDAVTAVPSADRAPRAKRATAKPPSAEDSEPHQQADAA
jgi:predicted transcriptional regulator